MPDLVDDVVARAVELWGEQHAGLGARRKGLEAELRRVERELGRFAEAIAAGEPLPTVLVGRLVLTPRQLPAGRFYEFTGTASYRPMLAGVVGSLVPPEGFARLAQHPIDLLIAA